VAAILAEVEPGRALDAACGTGRHAAVLAELGHQVVGVDASAAMLERARQNARGVDLMPGELESLPLETGSVDLAVCSLALTHLADLEPALTEFARVVRPGGRIVVSDVHPCLVALGAQAFFRNEEDEPGYVRNHVHWPGMYLQVFRTVGLSVLACHELPYGIEEVDLWVDRLEVERRVVIEALVGLPAVLVWDLARA
jgi:ubiquinone/menaquinone biosynthesis C-methylase UbiE